MVIWSTRHGQRSGILQLQVQNRLLRLNDVVARKKTWNGQSSAFAVIAKIRDIPMPMKMTMIFTRRTLKWTILTSND
jgi:hypothetical protein